MIFIMSLFELGGLVGYVGQTILFILNKQISETTGNPVVSNDTFNTFDTLFSIFCPMYNLIIPLKVLESAD